MSSLKVCLFGKLSIQAAGEPAAGLEARKVQELFCYLLIFRHRPHPRETLAGILWGDSPTSQSKKYLRQALWMLQSGLEAYRQVEAAPLLSVDDEWVQVNPQADIWLDAAELESVYQQAHAIAAQQLEAQLAESLRVAVDLYQGDLLEGWYQDWCLFERERYQNMYLALLGKLASYCEIHQDWLAGLDYSARTLRFDRASERTYAQLMRLYYLSGDRSEALRQYERCCVALRDELGVRPSRNTQALYAQIRSEQLDLHARLPPGGDGAEDQGGSLSPGQPSLPGRSLVEMLENLRRFQAGLAQVEFLLQVQIQELERVLQAER